MTRLFSLRLPIVTSILLGVFLLGCSDFTAFDPRMKEGMIEYDVTFPYLDDSNNMMASLLPEKMNLYFQKDQYVSELATVGGLFKNRFVSYQDEKKLVHQLKIFKKKLQAEFDETSIQRQLMNLPQVTIIHTSEIDTVAGFRCKKAIGIFDHISLPEMTIYYTDEINIESPNWCTQFQGIDGVLLQYEVEQLGIRMRFRATSVHGLEVTREMLEPEDGYDAVSPDQLQFEIQELMNTFNM